MDVYRDDAAVAARIVDEIADAIHEALAARGVAHIALSGGRTPTRAYGLLGARVPDWSAVHLWYADERCVPPGHPESTHRLVRETLDAPGSIEHRVKGELDPREAARAYAAEFGETPCDVVLLGLGEDGHTASLFPYGHALTMTAGDPPVVAVRNAPKPPPDRVTMTLPTLGRARRLLLAVTGEGKRDALHAVLGPRSPVVPASMLRRETLTIVADDAAASAL